MAEKVKIPRAFKSRVKACAKAHDFDSPQAFADHIVYRRLAQYDIPESITKLKAKFDYLVDEHGYADRKEVIEHLMERGLLAYEEPAASNEDFEARLRGLGYLE